MRKLFAVLLLGVTVLALAAPVDAATGTSSPT
jgi:hypothetical protein